jgi:signal transduction histidine kinase
MKLDRENRLWVTTRNNGLVCVGRDGRLKAYVKDDYGNIVDQQQSLVIDTSQKIWLATSNGIYFFDPVTETFRHYTLEDGFPSRDIAGTFDLLSDGSIGYDFIKGLFKFYPGQMTETPPAPKVHLTSFSINGKTAAFSNYVDVLDTVSLAWSENNLTVEFAAINFTNPASTLYSCLLEGIDKHWSSPQRSRIINYSQLRPGNYKLRIRAATVVQQAGAPEKILHIILVPAWWQTVWFRGLVVFFLLVALVFTVRFFLSLRYRQKIARLERLQEIEAIRSKISRDIHDEIGSGLTKIKLMSRNLNKNAVKGTAQNELSQKIISASNELIQNMGEIVWTINPANDTLENIVAFLRHYISRLFEANPETTLRLHFPLPAEIPSESVNPEVKRNLILIVKEVLTNVMKHAKASEVQVSLRLEPSRMILEITDNGTGMDESSRNAFGNGIKNMQKRAESIQAGLHIETHPGRGTSVGLKCLLPAPDKNPLMCTCRMRGAG